MIRFTEMLRKSILLTLLSVLCAANIYAQNPTGTLRGRVVDERGALIVGAVVTARNSDDGVEKSALTDGDGNYEISNLAPGKYVVRATAKGFADYEVEHVITAAGGREPLNIQLGVTLGRVDVTVTPEAAVNTEPEGNMNAIVLRGTDLEALPDDAEGLVAALKALAGPSAGPDGGEVYIDGFTGGRVPPKSSIREVRINQNPYSAEFDRLGFGRIEIITKAGTAKFEGSLFYNFNDESLNARNPFVPARAPFQSRRYGGNLAGPLVRNKASFFVDFERREIDDNAVINALILDNAFNVVPFADSVLVPQRRTTFSPRFDYQLNPNHTLVGRYTFTDSRTRNMGVGDFSLLSRAYNISSVQHTAQITETAVLTPQVINEVRFQYARETRRLEGDDSTPAIVVLDAFTGGGAQVALSKYTEDRWELGNNVMFTRGLHTVRTGGRLRGVRLKDLSPQNFNGTYTFTGGLAPQLRDGEVVRDAGGQPVLELITSVERYRRTRLLQSPPFGLTPAEIRERGGGATQFSINGGDPEAQVSQTDFGLFVQDDWRLRPNLLLSLGLRYEAQTNIDDGLDFAPRVAVAWAPGGGKQGSTPKTVLRGGFGVFYSRFGESLVLQAARFNGINQQQFIINEASVLDRFPAVPSVGELTGFAQPQTVRRVADDLRAPYSLQSSLSVERQLPFRSTLTVTYLNLRTLHVLRTRNINAPLPETAGASADEVRPLGDIGNVYQYESSGNYNLSRLEVLASTRFHRRLTLNAAYGLGRAKGDTDGVNSFPANQYDLRAEYGDSSFDIRHRFYLTGSISAPWGVRLSPLIVAASGRPFNITTGRDANGDTLFTERPAFATDLTRPGVVVTRFGAFDPEPLPGQEIIPRNYGRGPAFVAVSLRASKTFNFSFGKKSQTAAVSAQQTSAGAARPTASPAPAERVYSLNLSVQAWNLLNHTNVNLPVGNLGSPFFGQATSLAGSFGGGDPLSGSRLIEMQVRFSF